MPDKGDYVVFRIMVSYGSGPRQWVPTGRFSGTEAGLVEALALVRRLREGARDDDKVLFQLVQEVP